MKSQLTVHDPKFIGKYPPGLENSAVGEYKFAKENSDPKKLRKEKIMRIAQKFAWERFMKEKKIVVNGKNNLQNLVKPDGKSFYEKCEMIPTKKDIENATDVVDMKIGHPFNKMSRLKLTVLKIIGFVENALRVFHGKVGRPLMNVLPFIVVGLVVVGFGIHIHNRLTKNLDTPTVS